MCPRWIKTDDLNTNAFVFVISVCRGDRIGTINKPVFKTRVGRTSGSVQHLNDSL